MPIWVPVSVNLRDHPKLFRLAELLGTDHPTAMGLLVNLWSWAVENAGPNGELPPMTEQVEQVIFRATCRQGRFVTALVEAGFIDAGAPMVLHNWSEWGGKYAEKRVKDRERARRNSAKPPRSLREASAKTSRLEVEEEREREVKNIATPSLASLADASNAQQAPKPPKRAKPSKDEPQDFQRWYALYPRKTGRPAALRRWLETDQAGQAKALATVAQFAAHWSKRTQAGDDLSWCPYPATYLHQRRFDDPLLGAGQKPRGGAPAMPDREEWERVAREDCDENGQWRGGRP